MTHFYKGVGVGTFFHSMDLRINGIAPANTGAQFDVHMAMQHICRGSNRSPCVSVTRSYGVAESYARNGLNPPSLSKPGYVYVINIPDPIPFGAPPIVDPVFVVASQHNDPLRSPSYHHNGSQNFLLGVISPGMHPAILSTPPPMPSGTNNSISPPTLTMELQTMVWGLRDAEALIVGNVPRAWVIDRLNVY
jgi:hypothetical protein